MKIEALKINGVPAPLGFALPFVEVSFKVRDTESKKARNIKVRLLDEQGRTLTEREGAELDPSGVELDAALRPRSVYRLHVSVEGDEGDCAEAKSAFETGKMDEPWTADWIAAPKGEDCHPLLRRRFTVRPGLVRARLYATGLGLFEAYLNGEKLGEEYLLPGVTNYETRLQVITFRADALCEGENELSFLLGKGWYMGVFGLENQAENYGGRMAVIGELHLDYADGSHDCLKTDGGFTWTPSQIVDSGIYYGETLDRSLTPGEEKPAEVLTEPEKDPDTKNLRKSHLTDRLSLPITVAETLPVREILHTPAGETVLDFGQNFAGFPEFDADFPAGTTITLDFGEILQQGNFYNKNYRDARSRFEYVSGGERETVHPHFTFFGFRYVRVSGWVGELKKESFRGCVLSSDLERIGFVKTGNAKLNRLYENTLWGLRSNFIDMPTDCPQRSERLGWTGDAQIFAPTAGYHCDTRAFYRKFEQDLMDEQAFLHGAIPNYVPNIGHKDDAASAWGDAGAFLPMAVFRAFGGQGALRFAYPMIKGWVDYMDRMDTQRHYSFDPPFQFGDWLGLDGPSETSYKGGTDDRFVGAAYYHHSAFLAAKAAAALGEKEDAARYENLAEQSRREILNEYFTPNGRFALDTQAAYVVALKFGLWRDRERLVSQFAERLKKDGYRIRCGFLGAPLLCTVLAENGMTELAYDFLLQEGFPSWLYAVNLGATTVWERWNSVGIDGTISDTGMNSLNHYAYGSVMEFLYAYGAGIRPACPGFRNAILAPEPDARLGYLHASYDSASGRYVCNTRICPDGMLEVHVEIPFGCEAELRLPRSGREPERLLAGNYDYRYMPERDYRKTFDENTPLRTLAQNEDAMAILMRLTPALGGMAAENNPEFSNGGLADFRGMGFLPIEPEKLEQAMEELKELIVWKE